MGFSMQIEIVNPWFLFILSVDGRMFLTPLLMKWYLCAEEFEKRILGNFMTINQESALQEREWEKKQQLSSENLINSAQKEKLLYFQKREELSS